MRFNFFLFLLVGFLAFAATDRTSAQGIGANTNVNLGGQRTRLNTITTAVPFLLITPDARSGGMGNAGVSLRPDRNAPHWNSSKLAFIDEQGGVGVNYTPWMRQLVNDIDLFHGSGYYKLQDGRVIGASVKYFSLGELHFTSGSGSRLRTAKPREYMIDMNYNRRLGEKFAAGVSVKYIYSDLLQGAGGPNYSPGQATAMDLSFFYTNDAIDLGEDASFNLGLDVSNIGPKISYRSQGEGDFLPINLRLGPTVEVGLNESNQVRVTTDLNKFLVPSPPIYDPNNRNRIIAGKDPDRSVASGIFGSFTDAPGQPIRDANGDIVRNPDGSARIQNGSRFREELREINISSGLEYVLVEQFFFRSGFFYEHPNKGNRQFLTLGTGVRYKWFTLDLSYLLPTNENNSMANTIRFSLGADF